MGGAVTIEKARTTKAMYYRMFPTCSPSRLEWGKKGGGVEKSNAIGQNALQKKTLRGLQESGGPIAENFYLACARAHCRTTVCKNP